MRKALMALAIGTATLAGLGGVAAGSGPASVHGIVEAAATGTRLAGVCVRLISAGDSRFVGGPVETSASGQFQFSRLAPGSYVISTCLRASSPYAQANVTAVAPATGKGGTATLDLVAGGSVFGTVTSEGGGPAPGLEVLAQPTSGTIQPVELFAPTRTAATGRYTITNLAPGRYFVEIGDQAGPRDHWGYGASHSVPLVVTAGRMTHAPTLAVIAEGGIVGTAVSSSTGRPLAQACLRAIGPGTAYPATTSPTGHFEFTSLLPGRWTIALCSATAGSSQGHSATIVVRAGRGSAAGRVRLP